MPPGVTTWDWFGQRDNFAQGRAGIYIGYGALFPSYDDPSQSKIVGLAAPAPCPREDSLRGPAECSFDEKPGICHQGGSSLAISRYSKRIEAAWILLQWATSADVAVRACLLGGGSSMVRRSTYDDPRVKERSKVAVGTTRHFKVVKDAILNRMGSEPHLPAWPSLSEVAFPAELGKMTTGQQGVKTTLANMAKAAEKAAAR
jgi:multiple sugar transport system substrate-binding protein